VHLFDAHAPYTPPFPYSAEFRDRPYDGEIAFADAQLGVLLEYLKKKKMYDNVLIVVAGDHGEGLYDHNERMHGNLVLPVYDSCAAPDQTPWREERSVDR
jgi:arylsulfatase A-like enzyme